MSPESWIDQARVGCRHWENSFSLASQQNGRSSSTLCLWLHCTVPLPSELWLLWRSDCWLAASVSVVCLAWLHMQLRALRLQQGLAPHVEALWMLTCISDTKGWQRGKQWAFNSLNRLGYSSTSLLEGTCHKINCTLEVKLEPVSIRQWHTTISKLALTF